METYDKTLKLIFDQQTTLLSRGMNPDEMDSCRFQSLLHTDDNYPGKEGQVSQMSVRCQSGVSYGSVNLH